MSEYQVMRWHQIPSLIVAREAETVIKVSLPSRFQEAIDKAAMRMGHTDADAYTAGWASDPWIKSDETPRELADRIADALEAEFSEERLRAIIDEAGSAI